MVDPLRRDARSLLSFLSLVLIFLFFLLLVFSIFELLRIPKVVFKYGWFAISYSQGKLIKK